jgi:hypothetical protein
MVAANNGLILYLATVASAELAPVKHLRDLDQTNLGMEFVLT